MQHGGKEKNRTVMPSICPINELEFLSRNYLHSFLLIFMSNLGQTFKDLVISISGFYNSFQSGLHKYLHSL